MSTDAIVIRVQPWREHDQLVTLYSRIHGKVLAVARGALRPTSKQALALDPGALIVCQFTPSRSQFPIITGAQALRSWGNLKSQPHAWAVAQFFLEVIHAAVFDDQPDEHVFAVLASALDALETGHEPLGVLREHQCHLLEALGYGHHDAPTGTGRSPLDDEFEQIAQRQFVSLRLIYGMV